MTANAPNTSDFEREFGTCNTLSEANALYRSLFSEHHAADDQTLYWALSEAHRRTLESMSTEVPGRRERSSESSEHRAIKQWARLRGMVIPKNGRVTASMEAAYNNRNQEE